MAERIRRVSPTNGSNNIDVWTEKPSGSVVSAPPRKPTNLSIVAFLVTFLFNHIFGFFALYFTVSAKHSWECKDYNKSKRHSRYAVVLIVLGIIIGLATYAIAFSLYFTLKEDTSCTTNANTSQNTAIVTAQCCRHCLNQGNLGGDNSGGLIGNLSCSLYCASSRQGPIIPDPTAQYSFCCSDLGCTQTGTGGGGMGGGEAGMGGGGAGA